METPASVYPIFSPVSVAVFMEKTAISVDSRSMTRDDIILWRFIFLSSSEDTVERGFSRYLIFASVCGVLTT